MAKKPFEAGGIAETNTFVDATDTTKRLTIDVNGTTGVTGTLATAFTTAKTITFPDTTGTVALTSDAPTASPTIEGKLYGYSNATNLSRTTLGYKAGNVATGNGGTLIGYEAGLAVSSGTDNTVIGSFAGKGITTSTANTIIGSTAMYSGNGSSNTVIGQYAGTGIGSNNTLVGQGILAPGSGVSNWIAIGDRIAANTLSASGQHNVVVGQLGMYVATSAAQNVLVGNSAGQSITSASNNVLLGYQAGQSLSTGTNNIVIGHTAAPSAVTVANEITLGNSSHARLRIPGLDVDTAQATNGQVLAWNTSTAKFNWVPLDLRTTTSVTTNSATTLDTNLLSGFTTIKYVVSIKQGTKTRSSELLVQTNGTSVDYNEYAVVETGGVILGAVVAASVSSTSQILTATITDATTTNATVKIQKILI